MKIDAGPIFLVLLALLMFASPVAGADNPADGGTIFTIWPLVDYRSSPREGFSNLSILGPLFKYQQNRGETLLAVRPLFYRDDDARKTAKTDYLYPVFSSESGPDVERFQALRGLFQVNTYRKSEKGGEEESSMFFPFYVKGNSPKYGPYLWIFR